MVRLTTEFLPEETDLLVLIPIVHGGDDVGRREAVPAAWEDEATARLLRPPIAADWLSTGALVEVLVDPSADGEQLPELVMDRVLRESHDIGIVWTHHARGSDEADRLIEALDDVGQQPGVVVTVTDRTVHISAPPRQAPWLRSVMRHLERDGLLREQDPFHRSATVEPTPPVGDPRKRNR